MIVSLYREELNIFSRELSIFFFVISQIKMSNNSLLKNRPFIYVALICSDNASPVSLLPLFREQNVLTINFDKPGIYN